MNVDDWIAHLRLMPPAPCPLDLREKFLKTMDDRERDALRILEAVRETRQKFKSIHGIIDQPLLRRCESMLAGEVRCIGIVGHEGKHHSTCPSGLMEWEDQ